LINSMLMNISHDPKFQGKKTIAVKIQRKNTAELKPACNRSQQEQSSPLSQPLTLKRSLEPKKSTAQKKTKKRIPQSFQSTLEQQEPHLQAKCAAKTPRAKYRQYTQSQLAQALDQIELGMLTIKEAADNYQIPHRTLWRKGNCRAKIRPAPTTRQQQHSNISQQQSSTPQPQQSNSSLQQQSTSQQQQSNSSLQQSSTPPPQQSNSSQQQKSPQPHKPTPKCSHEPKNLTAQKRTKYRKSQPFLSPLEPQSSAAKSPRIQFRQYTQSQLVTALDQIKLGMLTITEASVKYLIPRRTLWRKVKKR